MSELEALLRRAKRREVPLSSVLTALRDVTLIVPVQQRGDGEVTVTLKQWAGRSYATVYTSLDQLDRVAVPGKNIRVLGHQVAARIPAGVGLAVNPDDAETTLAIPPEALAAMTEMSGTLAIGAPGEAVPPYLSEAVSDLTTASRGVEQAYIFQVHDGRQPALRVGLVLTEPASPSAVQSFAEKLASTLPPDADVQVMRLPPSLLAVVQKYAAPVTPRR